jgi:hypothetical protein
LKQREASKVKRNIREALLGICTLLLVTSLSGITISAETVTVTGTVNTDYEIIADDGQVYEVTENLKGQEVVELIDRKVRVTGSVTVKGGIKKIRIDSYEVIDNLKK